METKTEKQLKNYYGKGYDRYKFQFGEYITNSYSILKIETELQTADNVYYNNIKNQLCKMWDDFKHNYKMQYSLNAKDIYNCFRTNKDIDIIDIDLDKIDIDNKYKKDFKYSIHKKQFNKNYRVIKFDTVNIKIRYDGFKNYSCILELVKNNNIVGYLMPSRRV